MDIWGTSSSGFFSFLSSLGTISAPENVLEVEQDGLLFDKNI